QMARKKTRSEEYAGGFPPGMEAFESLTDPRGGRAKRHYFGEVLFIALAAMVSGMDDFEDFERFAQEREEWLRQWLKLPNGTPSDDTFRRIFTALDPKAFGDCFVDYTALLSRRLGQELVAIDGKTLRGSFQAPDKSDALHLISAWATASGLTLGQLLVDSKTNEPERSGDRPPRRTHFLRSNHRRAQAAAAARRGRLRGEPGCDGLPKEDRHRHPPRRGGLPAGAEGQPRHPA